MKTTDAARGHWPKILEHFGIDGSFLDKRHHKCPSDGGGDDRFRFTNQNDSGSYFCACSQGDKGGFGLLQCVTGRAFKDLAAEIDTLIGNTSTPSEPRMQTYAEQLRAVAQIAPRSAYLESRGLEMPPGLLWAKAVDYRDEGNVTGTYPAMLAAITRAGEWQTFHVTYLDKGAKAAVTCPRKILPGGSMMGGGVELYPAEEIMGVSEGIETAIAAKMLYATPTHAALNAGALAKWDPPAIAKEIYIFADNDHNAVGAAAAWTLCSKLRKKGLVAEVIMPPNAGEDWNDVLLSRKVAA